MSRTVQYLDSSGSSGRVVTFRKDWKTMWIGEKRTLATHRVVVGFIYIVASPNMAVRKHRRPSYSLRSVQKPQMVHYSLLIYLSFLFYFI